jgi:hypothetical protein
MKLTRLLVLVLAAVCGLGSSCSYFDGKPRKRKPTVLGPSTLPAGSPMLGGDSIDLGGVPDQSGR